MAWAVVKAGPVLLDYTMIHFQNPDRQWFKKTISQWVRGKMAMNKYEYLLDHYLVNGKINVVRPVTAKNGLVLLLKICVRYGRFVVWLAINRLSFSAFNIFL